jgi:hypothetical protein
LFFYKKNIFSRKAVSLSKGAEIPANAINMKSSAFYVASMVGKKYGRKKASAGAGLVAKNRRRLMYCHRLLHGNAAFIFLFCCHQRT